MRGLPPRRAWLALAAALAFGAPTRADEVTADLRTSLYQDDDATTISTSTIAARGRPFEHLEVGARYLVDVTTSASVDVVTAATRRWEEARHEGEGTLGWSDGTRTASATYVRSVEPDWASHNASLGLSHDLFAHDLTLAVGASAVFNAIGRAEDSSFAEQSSVWGASARAVVVTSPRDIWSLGWTGSRARGYQSSPYRMVLVDDGAPGPLAVGAPEVHPEARVRHALTLRWNHHAFGDTSLRSHLRGYADDWGVASLTGGIELVSELGDFEAAFGARGYVQRRAAFYRAEYAQRMRYMTADRELSSFWDVFVGPRLGYRSHPARGPEEIRADVRLTGFFFRFPEFPRLPERYGLVAELGLGVTL